MSSIRTPRPLRPARTVMRALALALVTCAAAPLVRAQRAASGTEPRARSGHRRYGAPVPVGRGHARAYVAYERRTGGAPVEIGVALDERALDGLPTPSRNVGPTADGHEHLDNHVYLLSLPDETAPYRFVELDWNPGGHEPPGVYDVPHFDFHFWTAPRRVRASVRPSDPRFQEKADMLPAEPERPPFFVVARPPGTTSAPGVPLMGVHWIDARTPELQPADAPAHRPFTTTFMWGSWEGRFVFLEPMITRAHILAKRTAPAPSVRDEVIPLPTPARVGTPGYYPRAYRIAWDPQAAEYRIALADLVRRD